MLSMMIQLNSHFFFYFILFSKALLSETATDDSQWPPELILLREKFTAKSQLEIAQLQIRHKEEVCIILRLIFLLTKFF